MKTLHNTLFLLCLSSSIAVAQTTVTYTYDELGRVRTATDTVNGNRAYDYDAAGNRTTLSVLSLGNRPPIAVSDSVTIKPTTPKVINVLANDSDPDGNPLTITSYTSSGNTTITNVSGGNITIFCSWAPPGTTSASLTYTISDGAGGTATANINITIQN